MIWAANDRKGIMVISHIYLFPSSFSLCFPLFVSWRESRKGFWGIFFLLTRGRNTNKKVTEGERKYVANKYAEKMD